MKQEFTNSKVVPWRCYICGRITGDDSSLSTYSFDAFWISSRLRICDNCEKVVCRRHSKKEKGRILCDNCREDDHSIEEQEKSQ